MVLAGLRRRQILVGGGSAAMLGTLARKAAAQGAPFPNRPVRILVGFPAGGGADGLARGLAAGMAAPLGQPVVVENRPGAGQVIAAEAAAKAQPDGHTLLLAADPVFTTNPLLYQRLPYNPDRQLAPLALVAGTVETVLVPAASPARTLRDLVELARARPGTLNYGSFGLGSTPHLEGEMLKELAGLDLVHVPFRGAADAMTALLADQIQLLITAQGPALPHIEAGKLRALAVLHERRQETLPGVPTVAEAGFPALVSRAWFAVAAPAGTPGPVLERLSAEILRAAAAPEFRQRFVTGVGLEPRQGGPGEVRAEVREDRERLGRLIRALDLKLD